MQGKFTPKNLTGWTYASRFLSDLYGYEYRADVWPERLGLEDIAALQTAGKDQPIYEAWRSCLLKASKTNELIIREDQWFSASDKPDEFWTGEKQTRFIIPPCHKEQCDDALFFVPEIMTRTTAAANDFADYLRKAGEMPSKFIVAWFDAFGIHATESGRSAEGVNDVRLTYILNVCMNKKINPLQVPYGKKGTIEAECLKNNQLFTSQKTFERAWEYGNKCGAICVENKEKYQTKQ